MIGALGCFGVEAICVDGGLHFLRKRFSLRMATALMRRRIVSMSVPSILVLITNELIFIIIHESQGKSIRFHQAVARKASRSEAQ